MGAFTRRHVVKTGIGLTAALALPGLGGVAAAATKVNFQLGWIANVENMGEFMADDKGDYTAEGLDITLTPGGPAVSVEPLVVSGKALVGLSGADVVARARLQGAKLKIVGATFQRNPSAVMSLASKPIRTPKDLVGKKLGLQQSGVPVYNAFFKANGIDPKSVTIVPVQFDPAPLVSGQVDAFASFQTNQPIQLAMQGVKTVTFLLADYNFNLWEDVMEVTEDTLNDKDKRATVVKVLRGTIKGWEAAVADPDAAAAVVVNKFGKNLNLGLKAQQLTAEAQVPLIQTADTKAHGLLSMSEDGIARNIDTMAKVGIKMTAKDLFDTSLLDEVFAGKNSV